MKTIFVIDDTMAMHYLYKQSLKQDDVNVVSFHNSTELFQRLRSEKPDLIITDYRLEGDKCNGYDIAKLIKSIYSQLPIIVVTGYSTEEMIIKLHEINVNHILNKPIDLENFKNLVFSLIDNKNDCVDILSLINEPKKRMIVLEDVTHMFNIYKMMFRDNFDVVHIKSFNELKQVVNKNEIDIIISDYRLNWDHHFDELLQYILFHFNDSFKILISGFMEELKLFEKYKNQFNLFYDKPVDFEDLKNSVVKTIKKNNLITSLENVVG